MSPGPGQAGPDFEAREGEIFLTSAQKYWNFLIKNETKFCRGPARPESDLVVVRAGFCGGPGRPGTGLCPPLISASSLDHSPLDFQNLYCWRCLSSSPDLSNPNLRSSFDFSEKINIFFFFSPSSKFSSPSLEWGQETWKSCTSTGGCPNEWCGWDDELKKMSRKGHQNEGTRSVDIQQIGWGAMIIF